MHRALKGAEHAACLTVLRFRPPVVLMLSSGQDAGTAAPCLLIGVRDENCMSFKGFLSHCGHQRRHANSQQKHTARDFLLSEEQDKKFVLARFPGRRAANIRPHSFHLERGSSQRTSRRCGGLASRTPGFQTPTRCQISEELGSGQGSTTGGWHGTISATTLQSNARPYPTGLWGCNLLLWCHLQLCPPCILRKRPPYSSLDLTVLHAARQQQV